MEYCLSLKIDEIMDKRLKSLMVDAIVDKAVSPSTLIDRIKAFLEEADENAFLYLGGFVTLPEIGEPFVIRQDGENVECVVNAVNITNATITLKHYVQKSLYFKTAEQATIYTNTGNKGKYSDWDNSPSETYQYEGENMVEKYEELGFDQL
jgi:hypothetical protein